MTSGTVEWINRANRTRSEVEGAIALFERSTGTSLHWVAKHHLVGGSGQSEDPFPRVEEHGGYLFGILYVPSNPADIYAEFDELVFVATHDEVLGSYSRTPRSTLDWPELFDTLSTDDVFDDLLQTGGRIIVRMLKTVVKQLVHDAENFDEQVNSSAIELGFGLDVGDAEAAVDELKAMSHRERRRLQNRAAAIRESVAAQRKEVPLMRRVITETESILARLANDELDLTVDVTGTTRHLFTRELEIFVSDAYIDARHVSSLMDDIEYRLTMIRDYLKQVKDDENVAANRFTGAIASIMLLPTFIVGLYGQNFGHIPELGWKHGYLFSWVTIAVVTVGQVWFFKRRKWL